MSFVIYFVGLIAHLTFTPAGEPEREVALAINATNHEVELVVPNPKDDIIPTPSRPTFPKTMDSKGRARFALTGTEIYVTGVPVGTTTTKDPTMKELISLPTMTGQTDLEDTVKKHDKKHGVYINLYGGTLQVDGYYKWMGTHTKKPEACVPSRISYTVNTGTGTYVEILGDKGQYLRLNASAKVYIVNLPAGGHPAHPGEYKLLMKGATSAGTWVQSTVNQCDTPAHPHLIYDPATIGKAASVECTNSTYP